jgi:hypothetical protein
MGEDKTMLKAMWSKPVILIENLAVHGGDGEKGF